MSSVFNWASSQWHMAGTCQQQGTQVASKPDTDPLRQEANSSVCICHLILSVTSQSLLFWLSSFFTTTELRRIWITSDAAPNHLSISRSIHPSPVNKTSGYLGQDLIPDLKRALHLFLADTNPGGFALSCELFQSELEITMRQCQQDDVICKKHWPSPEDENLSTKIWNKGHPWRSPTLSAIWSNLLPMVGTKCWHWWNKEQTALMRVFNTPCSWNTSHSISQGTRSKAFPKFKNTIKLVGQTLLHPPGSCWGCRAGCAH